jgi:predicted dehydrogenase
MAAPKIDERLVDRLPAVRRLWRPQSYHDEPGRGTKHRDGGGVLITQAIHTLDLMLSLAGPVREVAGFWRTSPLHRMETEDMVCGALRYGNGAIGTVDATTAAYPGFAERIELICRHGSALLAGTSLEVLYHDGTAERVAADQSSGGTGADPMDFPHDYHRSLIADYLDAIGDGRDPRATGAAALQVHRLIDALIEAGEPPGR